MFDLEGALINQIKKKELIFKDEIANDDSEENEEVEEIEIREEIV